jgi:hypothetical protein
MRLLDLWVWLWPIRASGFGLMFQSAVEKQKDRDSGVLRRMHHLGAVRA